MSDPYTPTTEEVRFAYIDRKGFILQTFGSESDDDQAASTEFDRWLASIKAEAWEEAVIAAQDVCSRAGTGLPVVSNPYRETETT